MPLKSLRLHAILFFFATLLYLNTLGNQFVMDDLALIAHNPRVHEGWRGIGSAFASEYWSGTNHNFGVYRPLTMASFQIEKTIFGISAFSSHLINVFLFAAMSCLVFTLFNGLLNEEEKQPVAFFAALVFASHPIHTEVVDYIKSRDELLCGLGLAGALWMILQYGGNLKRKWLAGSLLAYAAALLSKETGLIFILLAPGALSFTRMNLALKTWTRILTTLIAVSSLYLVARYSALGSLDSGIRDPVTFPFLLITDGWNRLASSFWVLSKYVWMSVVPYPLLSDYSFNQVPEVKFWSVRNGLSIAVLGAFIGLAWVTFSRKKTIGLALFFLLLPLSIAFVYSFQYGFSMAERFLFVPSIGASLAIAVCCMRWPVKFSTVALAGIVCLYSFLTFVRNREWHDNLTLFKADIPKSEENAREHFVIARELRDSMRTTVIPGGKSELLEESIQHLKASLRIYPRYGFALIELGAALGMKGDYAGARNALKKGVEILPNDDDAFYFLGAVDVSEGRLDSAIAHLSAATKLNARHKRALLLLADVYERKENTAAAKLARDIASSLPED